jgi:hypothetical protein
VSQISIKDQISKLIDLQAVDSEIYRLKKERQEKPQQIAELQKKFQDKKDNLKILEEKTKALQVKIKDSELELQTKEGNIDKAQTQLYQIKTNKEYQAKLVEIEGLKADKSVIEENIIKILDDIDRAKIDIEKEKAILAEEEKRFNEQKQQVEGRIKEIEDRLSQLDAKRKQILPDIDKKILDQYERILVNREGLALVSVNNFSCQGCFMNVPPQVVNEIKKKEKLVICEVCSRILYIEGEF